MATTYKQAGVDIEAGDALVERIKPLAKRTLRPEVLSGVGGFGGLFELAKGKYKEPVLVSGTDGVGTKLKLAFQLDKHDTVGIDLVAMSVNDVLCSGAEPLFFLDYFACSKLDVTRAEAVISGIAKGCELSGCTLLGGETAELPGFYSEGEYDLAGFCVAIAEKSELIDGRTIAAGDALVGFASSGLHSNGFSLARKIVADAKLPLSELGPAMLTPTRIYVLDVLALMKTVKVKGLAHITGSGIPGNLPRCIPDGLLAVLSEKTWARPPLFELLQKHGEVERKEMFDTFNMGLGLIAVVSASEAAKTVAFMKSRGVEAFEVGRIEAGTPGAEATVVIDPVKIGVLASGSGTNFQALVEGLRGSSAQVAVLVCNVPGAKCLERAKTLGVAAEVLDHKAFGTREAYDDALIAALEQHQVEAVCLAGFMRLLTPRFLAAFPSRVLNVHPALLPSFPGIHGLRQALDYGAKVTGCTVHFVDEGTDTGPVIAQAAQPVLETDDEASLAARVHSDEHRLYPQAVRWLAEGRLKIEGRKVRVVGARP